MTTTTVNSTAKTFITRAEFEKKVDIEAAHLEYFDRLKPNEAREKAIDYVASKFAVSDKRN